MTRDATHIQRLRLFVGIVGILSLAFLLRNIGQEHSILPKGGQSVDVGAVGNEVELTQPPDMLPTRGEPANDLASATIDVIVLDARDGAIIANVLLASIGQQGERRDISGPDGVCCVLESTRELFATKEGFFPKHVIDIGSLDTDLMGRRVLKLKKTGRLEVRVTDSAGAEVSGAFVRPEVWSEDTGQAIAAPHGWPKFVFLPSRRGLALADGEIDARTDKNGIFEWSGCPVDQALRIVVLYKAAEGVSLARVSGASGYGRVDVVLDSTAQLEGRVVYEDGLPAAGVVVRVYPRQEFISELITDADGRYTFRSIARGPKVVRALNVKGAEVDVDVDAPRVTAPLLEVPRDVAIRGRVAPGRGGLLPEGLRVRAAVLAGFQPVVDVQSDGVFSILLPPGPVQLEAFYSNEGCEQVIASALAIAPSENVILESWMKCLVQVQSGHEYAGIQAQMILYEVDDGIAMMRHRLGLKLNSEGNAAVAVPPGRFGVAIQSDRGGAFIDDVRWVDGTISSLVVGPLGFGQLEVSPALESGSWALVLDGSDQDYELSPGKKLTGVVPGPWFAVRGDGSLSAEVLAAPIYANETTTISLPSAMGTGSVLVTVRENDMIASGRVVLISPGLGAENKTRVGNGRTGPTGAWRRTGLAIGDYRIAILDDVNEPIAFRYAAVGNAEETLVPFELMPRELLLRFTASGRLLCPDEVFLISLAGSMVPAHLNVDGKVTADRGMLGGVALLFTDEQPECPHGARVARIPERLDASQEVALSGHAVTIRLGHPLENYERLSARLLRVGSQSIERFIDDVFLIPTWNTDPVIVSWLDVPYGGVLELQVSRNGVLETNIVEVNGDVVLEY